MPTSLPLDHPYHLLSLVAIANDDVDRSQSYWCVPRCRYGWAGSELSAAWRLCLATERTAGVGRVGVPHKVAVDCSSLLPHLEWHPTFGLGFRQRIQAYRSVSIWIHCTCFHFVVFPWSCFNVNAFNSVFCVSLVL